MGAELNQNQTPGLQGLEVRLHTLIKQIDTLRLAATPNILFLESAEENLQLSVNGRFLSEAPYETAAPTPQLTWRFR